MHPAFLCTMCCNGVSWRIDGVITHMDSAVAGEGAACSAGVGSSVTQISEVAKRNQSHYNMSCGEF